MKFPFYGEENIVGKGENAGFQHFLLSQNVFNRLLFKVVKSGMFSQLDSLSLKKLDFPFMEKKILWEKEKMLVNSIFSFSHNVFNRLLWRVFKSGMFSHSEGVLLSNLDDFRG